MVDGHDGAPLDIYSLRFPIALFGASKGILGVCRLRYSACVRRVSTLKNKIGNVPHYTVVVVVARTTMAKKVFHVV